MRTTSRTGPEGMAKAVGDTARTIAGLIRRMVVSRSSGGVWQLLEHLLLDDEERQTRDAELFQGVGVHARPAAEADGGEVEAIVALPNGGGNPLILASRQEAARKIVAVDLAADESQLYGALREGGTVIRIKRDGTVEIRTVGGTAKRLATVDDLEELRDWIHTQMVINGGGAGTGTTTIPPAPTGTTVLKAE